ncbi:MAG: MFS transporter [Alphaproteobacteria bacterium]|nr:MFS transporter [Alphaproteobacteria bacterium]
MSIRPPVWTTRLTTPGANAFAILSGFEALTRAFVAAALPIQTQALFGNDESVSALILTGSVASLAVALFIPKVSLMIGRSRLCFSGLALLALSAVLFMLQIVPAQVLGFVVRAMGTAIFFAVLSMYIMDHVRREQIGRSEPLRLLFIGLSWTFGPLIGVKLEEFWGPWAPFAASGAAALVLIGYFWTLRMGNSPVIGSESRRVSSASWENLRQYMAQPRLVLSWMHGIGRGFFWGVFNIYTPLFAVQTGLGAAVGGTLVGIGSAFLLAMPAWGWCARRFGIRAVSLVCFPLAALGMFAAGFLSASTPWIATGFLLLATLSMAIVDGYGNALFLRACKPSQRTAMTPIFSTQRDIAEISHAGAFAILLIFFPIQVVFITVGVVMLGMLVLAFNINRRL